MTEIKKPQDVRGVIDYLNGRIKHVHSRIDMINEKEKGITNKTLELTYHAGWNRGYWEGRLSALEDARDNLADLIGLHPEDNVKTVGDAE